MFSEYASRFLAQSQSRFSNFVQQDNETPPPRNPNERYQRSQPLRSSRHHRALGNPYQSSHLPNFGFTSRYSQAPPDAPLFHSALNEFQEEDEEEERERETADFFALQRSRRVFAPARLEESEETERDGSDVALDDSKDEDRRAGDDRDRPRGIKSSWTGGIKSIRERGRTPETVGEEGDDQSRRPSSRGSSSKGKGKMVDVGLESTIADSEPPSELGYDMGDDNPPAIQQFRSVPKSGPTRLMDDSKRGNERDIESHRQPGPRYPIPPSEAETIPATVATTLDEGPKHDMFWGSLFLICLGSLFATFFLIFLHTSTPKGVLGDTIYTTLSSSFHLMKGSTDRTGVQDRAMRWLSFIPGALALLWLYTIYKGRQSLTKAINILEFASRILAANPGLLALGFATLGAVVLWTWIWLGMFTRVFLGGHLSRSGLSFIIDVTTWWLGVYFVMMYIWTLSVIGGIQRTTTAATVSQWYYHRNVQPGPTSREIVGAAFFHSTNTIFGTICLSALLALLIRLPLLVLPRRLVTAISIIAYSFIPTPVAALLNPLALTYAAIHSQPLQSSARGLSQMTFLTPQAPTTTLTPRSFSSRTHATTPLLPYRLAKLLLHATRVIMSMALGFGGWVATARQLSIRMPEGPGIKGSAYAYVVGLVAGFIGWGVLGAMEGVLSGIVDATVVCWGSEKGMAGGGAYCLEAGYLFGDSRE
ncbi:hypothetical protein EYC84_011605 [Monilinia fructicola]|uniref:Protein PNS1 n=1 Tax=Monilinia fructicola TaxID=38448 RepID=A0A5M9J842_MONFR|nr:hypothetical protein EYC84_011605 [Monilinia fructicola]